MEAEELIRKHIMGNCTPEEAEEVAQRLRNDAEFEQQYQEVHWTMKGVGLSERDRLKEVLQNQQRKKPSKWYMAAAIVPLLIVAYLLWFYQPNSENRNFEELYASNYEPYGVYEFGAQRGSAAEADTLEVIAFAAYQKREYAKALNLLTARYEQQPVAGLLLYQAICLMELSDHTQAISLLQQIPEDSPYYQLALWYQGLSYLKLKQKGACLKALQELQNFQGALAERGARLSKRL